MQISKTNDNSLVQVDQLVRGLGGDFTDCYTDNRQPFPPALVLKVSLSFSGKSKIIFK